MSPAALIRNLAIARSGVYSLESLPFAMVGRMMSSADLPPPTNEQVKSLWQNIVKLHARESQNLENGIYPWRALELENPLRHARSFVEVLGDGLRVAWRMRNGKTKDIDTKVAEGMPSYYARNFHFQTDGYFSEASARRY